MRLIDADALKARIMMDAPDFMDGGSSITKAFIMAMVGSNAATPTIDAVPVTRCKDCKQSGIDSTSYPQYWCSAHTEYHDGDWFCADGERK